MATTNTELVRYQDSVTGADVALSIADIKRSICPLATDQEAINFLELCRYMGLNPFVRDAYLIKYSKDADASMVVGKDAFVKRAEAHPQFSGMTAGVIVRSGDAEPIERKGSLSLDGESIVGGWANVYRNDHKIATEITVKFAEFSTGRGTWQKMPGTMIRKVALVTALREAFPSTFSGLYDSSEMKIDLDDNMEPLETTGGTVPKVVVSASKKVVENVVEADVDSVIELEDADPVIVLEDGDIPESDVSGENLVLENEVPAAPPETASPPDCTKDGHGAGVYQVMESPTTGERRWAHQFPYTANGEEKTGWCVYQGTIAVPTQ